MARVVDYVEAYSRELTLPWRQGLAGSERVWMLVYSQKQERSFRAAFDRFKMATKQVGRKWLLLDISDQFGTWLANFDYAEALFEDPDQFSPAMYDYFEQYLIGFIQEHLASADEDTVVGLIGIGSVFPFLSASAVIKAVDEQVKGRLLVFFPGNHNRQNNVYRLLNARDGFNYRAIVIDPHKDAG